MNIQNDYSRQVNIFKPEEFNIPVHIIGAGATGSWVALSLAKMGITNINVYDYDEVGMHNLPNQAFRLRDIEGNKAEQIRQIIKQFTGINIKAHNEKLDGSRPLNGIVFMLTDTMGSRTSIYKRAIKNNPNIKLLIETRMDLRGGRIYAIDPKNRIHTSNYENTLYQDDEAEVSACGTSQTILPTAFGIVSNAIWKMLNFINEEPYENETIVDFSNEILFNQFWKEIVRPKKNEIQWTKENMLGKIFHCKTEENANKFAKICRDNEIKWITDRKMNNTKWEIYGNQTCYLIEKTGLASYADLEYFKEMYEDRKDIIEFK